MLHYRVGAARIVFTDRHGGHSSGPYASNNLGTHVGDSPSDVARNRASLAATLGVRHVQFANQVHGSTVQTFPSREPACAAEHVPDCDAFVLTKDHSPHGSSIAVGMMTADCVPIALIAGEGTSLAVIHAGWRGLVAGVVPAAINALEASAPGTSREQWQAYIGPCARASTYEFGEADLAIAAAHLGAAVRSTTSEGNPSIDLVLAVQLQLAAAGITPAMDCEHNTMMDEDYFSYRRSGVTGRQAVIGWFAE